MSTVLTNGIIIPDNGSRNWGGDLANNWNILDVHVGYMTDVKNKVTTLENSTAENTANIQTNASNISALQTSKQDVIEDLETIRSGASAGATAVQPSTLNNYVDLSSEQTISGVKTFTSAIVGGQLGTSAKKWKTLNGINPGALSLPSLNFINLDTTNFDPTNAIIGTFASTVDGWAILSINQQNKPFGIWILQGSYRITFSSVHHNDRYMIFALIPVRANINMTIYCTSDDIDSTRIFDWLRLFPCQGNV